MSDQSERWPGGSPANARHLAELYRRHASWLTQRMRRRWGAEADDIAQDAWLRLARYDGEAIRAPRALLARITRNLEVDRLRRASRETTALSAPDTHQTGGQFERALLREVIASMPAPLRDVFLLSRFAAFSHREIGQRLGISEKTVEWRLARALSHCAERLEVQRGR